MPSKTTAQEHRSVGVIAAAPWRVRAIEILPAYRLAVTCNDGTTGIVDMSALVNSAGAGIFAALRDVQLFQQAGVELGAITWPNGADLDPVWVHEEVSKNKTWAVPF